MRSRLLLAIALAAIAARSASAQCTCGNGANQGHPCSTVLDCPGGACVCPFDHLKCYKIQDSLPAKTYTADLSPKESLIFSAEPGDQQIGGQLVTGCRFKTPANLFCIDVQKRNAREVSSGVLPPGAPVGPDAGDRLCYKLKCPNLTQKTVTVQDQLGTRSITVLQKTAWLCTPAFKCFCSAATHLCVGGPNGGTGCTSDADCSCSSTPGCGACGIYALGWGTVGSANGQLAQPLGAAADGTGNVYIAEWGNARVSKFTSSGGFELKWGTSGNGNGQFMAPKGIALDGVGGVYVVDSVQARVQKFDTSGTFTGTWGTGGSALGQFNVPWGIAANATYVYVADRGNDRIQRFDLNGNFPLAWGSTGSAAGQFDTPNAVAVDQAGNVYVADTNNDRIQKFDANGSFLTTWGSSGSGPGQFQAPVGVAVSPCGVFVSENSGAVGVRVQRFDTSGNFLQMWGSNGTGAGQFTSIDLIGSDPVTSSLYVPDYSLARVQRFDCD